MISAASVYQAFGDGALSRDILPLDPAMRVCGPAFPVASDRADNRLVHEAIVAASRGDVLAIGTGGRDAFAFWGELTTRAALGRGLGGVVVDGCVRDSAAIVRLGFPVFARGTALRSTGKRFAEPESLGRTARVGGAIVERGDLIVGDRDGVVVVPAVHAEAVLALAHEHDRREAELFERIARGATTLEVIR